MKPIPTVDKKTLTILWEEMMVPRGYDSLDGFKFPLKGKEIIIVPNQRPIVKIQNVSRNRYLMEFIK